MLAEHFVALSRLTTCAGIPLHSHPYQTHEGEVVCLLCYLGWESNRDQLLTLIIYWLCDLVALGKLLNLSVLQFPHL